MRYVHAPHIGDQSTAKEPGDYLLIRRGSTRFPLRPLTSERFLIGSGTNCHLQLGGGIPMVHSLLIRHEAGWAIEAIAPEPPVAINGSMVRSQVLRPDDVVQLGPFEFQLCRVGRIEESARRRSDSRRSARVGTVG